MSYMLGFDVGTTGTKTLVIDEEGRVIVTASSEYPLLAPRPNWAEQNPAEWWKATCASIGQALTQAQVDSKDIAAVGLTGQMHGSVFLDGNNQVIRPAILWCDQRTAAECEEIEGTLGGRKGLIELTSNPALTGFTAPKILWLRHQEPENYQQVRKVLLPKDYIRFLLTGEYATDVSDASGTLLFDVRRRCWSPEVLEALDIPEQWLPSCYESPEVVARVSAQGAQATGLSEGTPVVAGGGDQAAGGVGSGIVLPGRASVVLGTSGVVFVYSEAPDFDSDGRLHTFCHAVPGKWHVMGVTLAAAGSLRWYHDVIGPGEDMRRRYPDLGDYDLLEKEAEEVEAGSEGLLFLPYLTGERTPHADANTRGVFFGLTYRHGRGHLVRSVMEGVAFSLRDCFELVKDIGISVKRLVISGGGARSPLWRQTLADVLGQEIVTINVEEGPAFGAALLAGVGSGIFGSLEQAVEASIHEIGKTMPQRDSARIYEQLYQIYRSLYPILKNAFQELGEAQKIR
ncbi:xylulokinase [Candidatus Hakubella thermalkaliphila]|uniref:Xylulose kinase n=1 Tax=Candidatus Hakubella thermalkaliphila TaxID=2754717 RepID=A0A6V8NM78_9ACTN|nr:xylulokinase [Candidatus Hakubella thermalkaliphila]GFP21422.1 xylulokinase [Candidatus Hakubella thermalkaliphila]